MVINICKMGDRYERLLKISAIEEAGLEFEQYGEVVKQIEEWGGGEFKIPRSLRFSEVDDKTPKPSDRYRLRTFLLNAKLIKHVEDEARKRELLKDSRVLGESILEFSLCEGCLSSPEFPLCDYLQEKYLQTKYIGGNA